MLVNILIGIDPFSQPGVDKIYRFDTLGEMDQFLKMWIYNDLKKCNNFIQLNENQIQHKINNLLTQFNDTNELKYKSMNDTLCEYEYKWIRYILE